MGFPPCVIRVRNYGTGISKTIDKCQLQYTLRDETVTVTIRDRFMTDFRDRSSFEIDGDLRCLQIPHIHAQFSRPPPHGQPVVNIIRFTCSIFGRRGCLGLVPPAILMVVILRGFLGSRHLGQGFQGLLYLTITASIRTNPKRRTIPCPWT